MRFSFYHAFTRERSLLLDLQAEEVIRLSRNMHSLTQSIRTALHCEPSNLPEGNSNRIEWMLLKTSVQEEMTKFGKAPSQLVGSS